MSAQLGKPDVGVQLGKGPGGGGTLSDLLLAGTGISLAGSSEPYTISADLSTGKTGGQSVIGGTDASDSLTLSSTANATKGFIVFGSTTGLTYDENLKRLAFGLAPASMTAGVPVEFYKSFAGLHAAAVRNDASAGNAQAGWVASNGATMFGGAYLETKVFGGSFTTSGLKTANAAMVNAGGTGTLLIGNEGTGDVIVYTAGTAAANERMRVKTGGAWSVSNASAVSFSSTTRIDPTSPVVAQWGLTPGNVASAAGATLDAHKWQATTITLTGTTTVATADGLNFMRVEAPTYTDGSVLTVNLAHTVFITGGPVQAGSVTIPKAYALGLQGTSVGTNGTVGLRITGAPALGTHARNGIELENGAFKIACTDTLLDLEGTTGVELVGNGNVALSVDALKNVTLGGGGIATSATDGFPYMPSCAGTPTGVPTNSGTNSKAWVYDRTNNKIFVYNGGWKSTAALT